MKSRQTALGAVLVAATLLAVVPLLSGLLRPDRAAGQSSAGYPQPETAALPPGMMPSGYALLGRGSQDPEVRKLMEAECKAEQEVAKLVAEYAKTEEEADRAKIKTKLAAALATQFDLQQKRRELELARVEKQLKKLRDMMKKRTDERKSIIDKRVDQLVREAEGLGWSPPPGLRPSAGNPFGATAPAAPAAR